MLILLFMIFIILALIDVPRLVRGKYWRELAVYSGLMLAALVLSALMVLGVPLPPVTTELNNLIKKVFHMEKP